MKRSTAFLGVVALAIPLLFMGCSGDDGAQGPPGPPGQTGATGAGAPIAFNLESCAICHDDQNVRNGDAHQSDYDERFQDNVVTVVPGSITYAFNAGDNTHTVTFVMTENVNGVVQPFNCTETSTEAPEDSLGIYFAEYTAATGTFNPPSPRSSDSRLSLGTQGTATTASTLTYLGNGLCSSTVRAGVEGTLVGRSGIILVYGRDDRQGNLPSPSRVVLSIHPFAGLSETATGGANVDYVSPASVSGCEKCHTVPFLKHGYIYGRVAGDNTNDFYSCKACHSDNGTGGHFEWQLLVDDPPLSARYLNGQIPPNSAEDNAIKVKYAYKTTLMNDVHMSHAMEFAYPQSMANCVVCHEGSKLDNVLTDNNFTFETCKSCHPVTGGTDTLGDNDRDGDLEFAFDTINNPTQAPPLAKIWADVGVTALHANFGPTATCADTPSCHQTGGGGKSFDEIHTGYDKIIYTDNGVKYSSAITVSIDNVSFNDNAYLLSFGFRTAGSAGSASSANIRPTILVGLYGFDTKDYIQGPHENDPLGHQNSRPPANGGPQVLRALEYQVGASPTTGRNSPYIQVNGGNVTVDLSQVPAWTTWIDNGTVKRVEVAVMPSLTVGVPGTGTTVDNVIIALNAPSKTFNIDTKKIEDGLRVGNQFAPGHDADFFGNSIVRVPGGSVGGVVSGCNNCHDALATTFHTPDRGGNIVVCRLCHITKAAGSHLELQSRSIDSYAHAIHRFQAFDTGQIDFNDPVEALHYEHHVNSNFPTFGVENCRACHNAGKFNVPDQSKSLPGVLSNTDFSTIRNISAIDNDVITGPATRACGACHRAEAIIANDGFGDPAKLANINSHMTTFGYMVETPPANIMDVIVQVFAALGAEGAVDITP